MGSINGLCGKEKILQFSDTDRENLTVCPWCGSPNREAWGHPVRGFDSVECSDCGLVYVRNRLNDAGLSKLYSRYLSESHQVDESKNVQRREMYELEFNLVAQHLSGRKILDVGCSGGYFLDVFKRHGYNCHGVEFGKEAAAEARKQHTVFEGQFPDLAIEGPFDLIVFRGVIEHVPLPKEYLDKAVSILGDHGAILITATPNADAFCCDLFRENWNQHEPEAHLMHFRVRHFDDYFKSADMTKLVEHYFYEETPYARIEEDILSVGRAIELQRQGKRINFVSPSFWKNMMTLLYLRK